MGIMNVNKIDICKTVSANSVHIHAVWRGNAMSTEEGGIPGGAGLDINRNY